MIFFTGMHHPSDAAKVPAAFVSIRAIANRKSLFPVRRCVIDSGAFQEINLYGEYRATVAEYAAQIKRWKSALGRKMLAAVAQDYMCEAFLLEKTGLMVADHQRKTIERYDALIKCDTGGAYIMPVLQGYIPAEYARHVRDYGARLAHRAWVGVGSICKRNTNAGSIESVLLAIKAVRPDLRLHGFGIKITALVSQLVRDLLFSADSMAWSFAARYEGRNGNCAKEAVRYGRRIATMATQLCLEIYE